MAEELLYASTIAAMTTLASARRDWEEGRRRLAEAARDAARADALDRQREAVLEELRRRVGGVYTLAELAEVYAGAERWVLEVVEARAPSRGWSRTAALAGDAAFHAYSLGARDYAP